ncbi:integrating conjugative element protein [Xenorhabdus cabanillasii]|uniref:Exported protein n=1 Tax=Xenorhabdus cabanillasii JM26 TaxID=1427517 RepID=W1J3S6_9GAMM|nr:integrating conjugative element protein [Xenorhabdus cabanillasii]PHM77108.1 membrane protein, Tfp pilus assembly, pilus retraction ATPase PilT [Xenorhabdus cabanillasii JM26]CDL84496.1 putative exported protein [Xenorhabdus cabanillasii JM26]
MRRKSVLLIAGGLVVASVQGQTSGLSVALPAVSHSALGYGAHSSGAVSDTLFYTLGGGSVISEPASRAGSTRLAGLELGWSSDLMCGNFDLKTTVSNQLNGITAGMKNLMSEVIQGATGAVASLPAMIIQRANPGLYDMLTNGVLQANVAFDKAQFNCQNMAKRMMDFAQNNKWSQSAALQEYKNQVNGGDGDAVRVNNAGTKATGAGGHSWIGGQRQGGKGQNAIRPTRDLASAGFNMMNQLPVLSQSSVSTFNCEGSACRKFSTAREAAEAVVSVLGDRAIRTCAHAAECSSGGEQHQPGTTVAGTGFAPMLEAHTKTNAEHLVKLISGTEKPTRVNLTKLKTGSLAVTQGVIQALQRDPDKAALTARLAGELAMSETIETALLMRRMLITGMSEPNAAAQSEALAEGDRRIAALDREINALKNEMELKQALSRNSILTIIERDTQRIHAHPQKQVADSQDARFYQLEAPNREVR